jgi:hypothetical protein
MCREWYTPCRVEMAQSRNTCTAASIGGQSDRLRGRWLRVSPTWEGQNERRRRRVQQRLPVVERVAGHTWGASRKRVRPEGPTGADVVCSGGNDGGGIPLSEVVQAGGSKRNAAGGLVLPWGMSPMRRRELTCETVVLGALRRRSEGHRRCWR